MVNQKNNIIMVFVVLCLALGLGLGLGLRVNSDKQIIKNKEFVVMYQKNNGDKVSRRGIIDGKSGIKTTKMGDKQYLVYFDINKNGYRSISDNYTISYI